jgi:hypothetical protein
VTYIPTREGWLYLAAVLDLYSRGCDRLGNEPNAGHAAGHRRLCMALGQRGRGPASCIRIRGCTYATANYGDLVREHGHSAEHVEEGNCWDTQYTMEDERPAQPDSCWDWPTCLGVDLSTAVRRSPSVAGPRVGDLIGALFWTVSVLSCERLAMHPYACRRTG